jgi:hypothetical protein
MAYNTLCLAVFAVTCFLLLSARAYYHQAAHALRRPDFVTPRERWGLDGHEGCKKSSRILQ